MEYPDRKLPRLSGFDYSSPNYYFITICTHNRKRIFGLPDSPDELGLIAEAELVNIEKHYSDVRVDKYVIMPNHIHVIIVIDKSDTERSRPFPTLSSIVGLYKSGVSRKIHEIYPDIEVWQKSFYDKVICNETAYFDVWQYIDENPLKWELDEYNLSDKEQNTVVLSKRS